MKSTAFFLLEMGRVIPNGSVAVLILASTLLASEAACAESALAASSKDPEGDSD